MTFAFLLLEWYQHNARVLPWRCGTTPYGTWISEIMLQQTQVDTVIPYFERWMEKFPTIKSLADANEQEVLSFWEGLGYYNRARNLHKAAKQVIDEYDGQLPMTRKALQTLPGIGTYTAAAIASIAFGENAAAVDGNIRRVYARYCDITTPIDSAQGQREILTLAEAFLPKGKAGDFNQALMDLGAMICIPKNPKCDRCPIAFGCLARQKGVQEKRPVKLPKKEVPHLTVMAAIIQKDNQVFLAQRPLGGILGGMWEFPGGTLEDEDADLISGLKREIREELDVNIRVMAPFGSYNHAYTHYKITLHAFLCELERGAEPNPMEGQKIIWVVLDSLPEFPMGKVDRRIAKRLIKERDNGPLPG